LKNRFVVHKHQATRLHYDLRLEIGGVLKSWAIPKEPPSETGIKRLAIAVDDHAVEYINFEGVIPEGMYGAGKVEIWDKGVYALKEANRNKLEFTLNGGKLKGNYVLIKFKDNEWLFFKKS
jgi:DNA ligase D-like protein (predicted 3'-phosphoesterase)